MDQSHFQELLVSAVEQALRRAEQRLGRKLPTKVVVELHGAGSGARCVGVDDVAAQLYLGPERYYRVIDVSVVKVGADSVIVFVRASAHPPGRWDQTWNEPPGMGPFKIIDATNIKVFTGRADG